MQNSSLNQPDRNVGASKPANRLAPGTPTVKRRCDFLEAQAARLLLHRLDAVLDGPEDAVDGVVDSPAFQHDLGVEPTDDGDTFTLLPLPEPKPPLKDPELLKHHDRVFMGVVAAAVMFIAVLIVLGAMQL